MSKPQYTSKKDAIQKGIVKKAGVFYKQNLLELWYSKGWLDLAGSPFGSEDRLRFGLKFAQDYNFLRRSQIATTTLKNDKIDTRNRIEDKHFLDVLDRYRKAVRSIPREFWPVVRQICLEERQLEIPAFLSDRQKAYFYFLYRTDLCRGLDRVISSYTSKLKDGKDDN